MPRHPLAVLMILAPIFACSAGEDWSLRDALLDGSPAVGSAVASALARNDDGFAMRTDLGDALDSDGLISLMRRYDAERAMHGLDMVVAAQVRRDGASTLVDECNAPLTAGSGGGVAVTGPQSQRARDALGNWLRGCAFAQIPSGQAIVAVTTDRLPALATFWAEAGVVFVHPSLVATLDDARLQTRVYGEPPFEITRESVAEGECATSLLDYCANCVPIDAEPSGSGAGSGEGSGAVVCEPLFASNYGDCAYLNALGVGRDEAAVRYCAWVAVQRWPDLNYCSPGCVIWGEPVLSWEALARTVPNLFNCQLAQCIDEDVVPSLPRDFGTFSYCVGKVEAYCDACAFETERPCPSLFPDSTAVADCYDLRRGELFGHGEEMFCAFKMLSEYNPGREYCPEDRFRCIDELRFCMNAYERCYDPNLVIYADSRNLPSYERLAEAFYPYADPRTALECQAQIERCTNGDPFPEESNFFEGPPTGGSQAGDSGGDGCGE